MMQWNRVAVGTLAAFAALAVGTGVYAMRDAPDVPGFRGAHEAAPTATAPPTPSPLFAVAPAAADPELTCEVAGACGPSATGPCPQDAKCVLPEPSCAPQATCAELAWPDGPCIEDSPLAHCVAGGPPTSICAMPMPMIDPPFPCGGPCPSGGAPAEPIPCFPPIPCGPMPMPVESATPVAMPETCVDPPPPCGPIPMPSDSATPFVIPDVCVDPVPPPGCPIPSDGAVTCWNVPPHPCGPLPEPGGAGTESAESTPCAKPPIPPDCTISSDGGTWCPGAPPPADVVPGEPPSGASPGSPGVIQPLPVR